ncbi:MAG: HAD-IA family hydrolase, partial [Bacteroidales bacterium]|nr:HAD-IA family hydrolase [Bacteroidales bacterium]
ITTSEEAGAKKPSEKIFYFALSKAGAKLNESLMIGDDYDVDVLGAKNVGMDQVLFAPAGLPNSVDCTFVVNELSALKTLL